MQTDKLIEDKINDETHFSKVYLKEKRKKEYEAFDKQMKRNEISSFLGRMVDYAKNGVLST